MALGCTLVYGGVATTLIIAASKVGGYAMLALVPETIAGVHAAGRREACLADQVVAVSPVKPPRRRPWRVGVTQLLHQCVTDAAGGAADRATASRTSGLSLPSTTIEVFVLVTATSGGDAGLEDLHPAADANPGSGGSGGGDGSSVLHDVERASAPRCNV